MAWDRQGSREVLQNLSWLSACKQSSKPRANQVKPITKWPVVRFGHRPVKLPSGEPILVIADYFSRYYEVEVMRSTTSEKVIECLEKIVTTHGLPLSLQSDNGPQFRSEVFEQYLEDKGIEHGRLHHCGQKRTARWKDKTSPSLRG